MTQHQHSFKFLGSQASLSPNLREHALRDPYDPLSRSILLMLLKVQDWKFETCWNPNILRCSECFETVLVRCGSADEDACAPCELRYRKMVRTVAREPLLVARPGSTTLLTLTAPGAQLHCIRHTYQGKPNRQGISERKPSVRCDFNEYDESLPLDGDPHIVCPCAAHLLDTPEKIMEWNVSAISRWNDFVTDLRRSVPGFEAFEYFKAVEPQARGAIHLHALTVHKRALIVTPELRALIRHYAMVHGFGHEVDIEVLANGGRDDEGIRKAARYVAKYVSKTNANSKKSVLLPSGDETYIAVERSDLPQGVAGYIGLVSFLVREGVRARWVYTSGKNALPRDQRPSAEDDIVTDRQQEFINILQSDDMIEILAEAWDASRESGVLRFHLQMPKTRPYRYRSWTASRKWGLNLARVKLLQKEWHVSPESYADLLDGFVSDVREFQTADTP